MLKSSRISAGDSRCANMNPCIASNATTGLYPALRSSEAAMAVNVLSSSITRIFGAVAIVRHLERVGEALTGARPLTAAARHPPMIQSMGAAPRSVRSEEHTSELQSLAYLVCRLL